MLMAAAEAQATGLPGVALVTLAPGITNAINGLAHAWLDRVPLLVVTGQHHPDRAPVIIRQGMDTHRLVDSVTKWTPTASARIHQVLARALDTALAPPARAGAARAARRRRAAAPLDSPDDWPLLQARARAEHAIVGAATSPDRTPALIANSRRPAIVVGGNCPTDAPTRAALRDLMRGAASARCSPVPRPWASWRRTPPGSPAPS